MAQTFFTFYNGNVLSVTTSGNQTLVEDPEVLGVTEVLVDGKIVEVTATSGVEQWVGPAIPSDYPTDDDERQRRRGAVR